MIGRAQGLPSEFARSLLETRDGTIWIGTVGGGLAWHRDGVTRKFETPLPSDTILSLAESPDGTLWVGTNRGLAGIRDGKVVRTIDQGAGLGDSNVNALQVDAQGRAWVGTASGLYVVDGEKVETVPLDGPLNMSIFCIRLESDGSAWIGSNGGLALLRDGKVFAFRARHGVPEDTVFQVLEDRVGFLWMSGNRGITKVSRAALEKVARDGDGRAEAVRYGRADGMRTNQCNGASQPAGWAARDGTLWFPTPWGAVAADLQRMPTNTLAPPVVIERIRVDGQSATLENGRIVLPAGQHRIEVDYAAMSFIAPEAVRFRTRLEGLDEQWVDAGTRRTEIYTNAVILSSTSSESAAVVAETARADIEQLDIRCGESTLITLSIGVATAKPDDGSSSEALMAAADEALYRAKHEGRNRIVTVVLPSDAAPVA